MRAALLQACQALATPDRAPTLRELAAEACVGLAAARKTIGNMRQAGALRIARERRVAYRTKPVAEYELVPQHQRQLPGSAGEGLQGLARVLTTWVG